MKIKLGGLPLTVMLVLALAACGDGAGNGNPDPVPALSGTITIRRGGAAVTTVEIGDSLSAVYSGTETVTFQWNRAGTAVSGAASSTYAPAGAGACTVTVSAAGYQSKTSAAVTVLEPPIEISDLAGLNSISANDANLGKRYKLMADIAGVTTPIGLMSGNNLVPFTGDFDGNGHTIDINITGGLSISGGGYYDGTFAGLFALVGAMTDAPGAPGSSGTVHDLNVTGMIGGIPGSSARLCAGGVAGVVLSTAEVRNVSSSVVVSVTGSSDVMSGGIAGVSQGAVNNVYTTGPITATGHGEVYAGGIVGASQGAMSYAYATGTITAAGTGTGPGDNSATIGAGGIAGAAEPDVPLKYMVALNSAVSATGSNFNRCSFRITSTRTGTVTTNGAVNYGKSDLVPTVNGSGPSHLNDKGANQQDGIDVSVTAGTPYTAPTEAWWTNTGFAGADWTTVWQWDATTGLPKLR